MYIVYKEIAIHAHTNLDLYRTQEGIGTVGEEEKNHQIALLAAQLGALQTRLSTHIWPAASHVGL